MKKPFLLLMLLCVGKLISAQFVYTIKADSVKITNDCDTAELIIENHTQDTLGFLYNKGKGRTEFRRVVKLNDSTLLFGEDTLVIRGGTTASNGLSLTGSDVQLGQNVGAAGNPAVLINNREVPMNGKHIFFSGDSGNVVIGSSTTDGFRLKTPDLQVGQYLGSESYFTSFHRLDSITSANIAGRKIYEANISRDVTYTEDGLTLPPPGQYSDYGLICLNVHRIGASLTLGQTSPYTGSDGAFVGLYLRKRSGYTGTSTFTGPSTPIGAAAALQARVDVSQSGLTPSNNLLANGWYCGVKPVITTSSNDVVQNFIWLNAGTGQFLVNNCVANGYGLYVNTLNSRITNRWAIYQEGAADTNYLAGKTKMPNLASQTDTASYKPMVVDNNGNVHKMSGWALSGTRKSITVTGSSYTVTTDIDVVFVNYTSGQATITLPSGTLDREITIKNLETTNTVLLSGLDTNESNSIAARGAITVKYTGSSWVGISKY